MRRSLGGWHALRYSEGRVAVTSTSARCRGLTVPPSLSGSTGRQHLLPHALRSTSTGATRRFAWDGAEEIAWWVARPEVLRRACCRHLPLSPWPWPDCATIPLLLHGPRALSSARPSE